MTEERCYGCRKLCKKIRCACNKGKVKVVLRVHLFSEII